MRFVLIGILAILPSFFVAPSYAEKFKGQIYLREVEHATNYIVEKVVHINPTIYQTIGAISVGHPDNFGEYPLWEWNEFTGEYGFIYEPKMYWLCAYKTIYKPGVYDCQGFNKTYNKILKIHNKHVYQMDNSLSETSPRIIPQK